MLESIVKNKNNVILHNNFFGLEQHGFRSMRSGKTQFLAIVEHWTRCTDNNQSIDMVRAGLRGRQSRQPTRAPGFSKGGC